MATTKFNFRPGAQKIFLIITDEDSDDRNKQETIKKKYAPCTEVYQKLSVDWDGKISACCGDYDNYLTVGDINNETLYNIWHKSEELKAIRSLLDKGRHKCLTLCSRCYHFYDEF